MNMIEKAVRFAYTSHKGQFRRDGVTPYITHVARVAARCATMHHSGDDEGRRYYSDFVASAWLHDVVEDCGVSIETIKDEFGLIVASNVEVLTKQAGQDYMAYLIKVAAGHQTRHIKLFDVMDNLSDRPTEEQAVRYMKALEILA